MLSELRIVVFADVLNFLEPAFLVNLGDFRQGLLVVVCKALSVDCAFLGHKSNRSVHAVVYAVTAVENPCEHAAVVAIARPHKSARQILVVFVLAEPVDVENLGQLVSLSVLFGGLSDVNPVTKVVAHVVSTEGQDCEGVAADFSDFSSIDCRSRGDF